MELIYHKIKNLYDFPDELQDLIEDTQREFDDDLKNLNESTDRFDALRSVCHEWLANMNDHANFGNKSPEVVIQVDLGEDQLNCCIFDNAENIDNFDFTQKLAAQQSKFNVHNTPDRGMGLMFIDMFAPDAAYKSDSSNQNILSFTISAVQNPW